MADDLLTDDVLDAVRAARERFAARHGNDVYAIGAALRRLAAESDWPVAGLTPVAPDPSLSGRPVVSAGGPHTVSSASPAAASA
jgi:hypothetical protein